MDIVELLLKFGEIGWKGSLPEDLDNLLDWLHKNFQIYIESNFSPDYSTIIINLRFQGNILCSYYNLENVVTGILPDVLLLWKCELGELNGPSLENFKEPNIIWT